MSLKKLFAGLALPVMIVAGAGAAQGNKKPDIADSFNRVALEQDFSKTCQMRQDMRRTNLRPPYAKNAPDDFRHKDTELVLLSSKLTKQQRDKAKRLFDNLPDHVRDIVYMQGGTYIMPRHSVVEAMPFLKDDPGYYKDSGLYVHLDRRVYAPFERGVAIKGKDGKVYVVRWLDSGRNMDGLVKHETGHMLDDLLGNYNLDSTGSNGDQRLTNRKDFMDAFERDLDSLSRKICRTVSERTIRLMGYYFPTEHKGKKIGGIREPDELGAQRNRREVFAELWAEAQGKRLNGLSRYYPRTFAVIKEIDNHLRQLHKNQKNKCGYTMDGRAIPLKP